MTITVFNNEPLFVSQPNYVLHLSKINALIIMMWSCNMEFHWNIQVGNHSGNIIIVSTTAGADVLFWTDKKNQKNIVCRLKTKKTKSFS